MANIKKGDLLPQIGKDCPFFIFKISEDQYVQIKNVDKIPAGTFEVVDTDIDKVIYKDSVMKSSNIIHNEYIKSKTTNQNVS